MSARDLQVGDIADLRQYEREGREFLHHVIELIARRRVSVGTLVAFLFENRDTVRFQIQQMAPVEKLVTDEAVSSDSTCTTRSSRSRGRCAPRCSSS